MDDRVPGLVVVRLEFKLADLWVGAFWKSSRDQVDVWICLIPCVPIRVTYYR